MFVVINYLEKWEQVHKDYQRFDQVLLALGEIQNVIGVQIKSNPHKDIAASVANLIPVEFPVPISYKSVSRDGTIIVVSHQTGMVFVLQPSIEADGKVTWSCLGNSISGKKRIPPDCRKL
jgi:hypothetical protein